MTKMRIEAMRAAFVWGIVTIAGAWGLAASEVCAQVTVDQKPAGQQVAGYARRQAYTTARPQRRAARDPYAGAQVSNASSATAYSDGTANLNIDGGTVVLAAAFPVGSYSADASHGMSGEEAQLGQTVGRLSTESMDGAFAPGYSAAAVGSQPRHRRGYSQAAFAYSDPYRARVVTRNSSPAGSVYPIGSMSRSGDPADFIEPYWQVRYVSSYPQYGYPTNYYVRRPRYYGYGWGWWPAYGYGYGYSCRTRYVSAYPGWAWSNGHCNSYRSSGNFVRYSSGCGLVMRFGF